MLIIMGAFNLTAAGIWAIDRVYYGKYVSEIEFAVFMRLSVVRMLADTA